MPLLFPVALRVSGIFVSYRYKSLRRASFNTRAARINHKYLRSIRKHDAIRYEYMNVCSCPKENNKYLLLLLYFTPLSRQIQPENKSLIWVGEKKSPEKYKKTKKKRRLVMHCISLLPFLFCFLLLSLISLFVGVTPICLLLLLLSSHCFHWLWQFLIYAAVEQ